MNFKAEVNDHCVSISSACSMAELCTVVTVITSSLYERMPTDADKFAFKMALKTAFASDFPFVSEEERPKVMLEGLEKELKKAVKGAKSESSSDEDDLQESVKNFLKKLEDDDDKAE